METYVLNVMVGVNEPTKVEINWDKDTFERYQNNELSEAEKEDLVNLAHDAIGLGYWIEEEIEE
ncbi:MAG: hypothetical protein Q4A00_08325 [Flavobacteriaceae bacterium]|nr:hypothetical protein [Flavobacteriaceae bacterium]